MPNDASQNPSNRWARNSGAGPGGVTEAIPTREEARRGLEPISTGGGDFPGRTLALGITALLGAVAAGAAVWKARRSRPLPQRIMHRIRDR